ncbi:histone-fold-containing protein [Blastocladiella britannica]|nr:histone-fold-containing protein [Blastocladiella britannica]
MDPDSIDDLLLPHSQISRIFKDAMPGTTLNVSREARIALNQATITFINYIAALAHEITTKAKKQTISANDLLSAIQAAEMHDLLPALREALERTG